MLIKTQDELNARIEALNACEFVTVDTEFLREKTYFPKLCLIQISGPDKDAFAIDPIEFDLDLSGLWALFENEDVLKVMHAARNDIEIFYKCMDGGLPRPVFDTQIAAMVCGYGDSVGYENLVRNITGAQVDKSSQYTNWSHRPLSDKQLNYALGDVTHLADVYVHLKKQLEKQGRTEWVFEEEGVMMSPDTYRIDPQVSWKRVKIRSPKPKNLVVLRALAAWREEEAQRRDLPKGWVLKDDTMADIAGQLPRKVAALKKIRNIPGDVTKHGLGEKLVKIVGAALDSPQDTWPEVKKKKPLPPSAAATLDILKMLLKVQAAEHGVATKLIASADDLEAFVLEQSDDSPILKGWRYDLFGCEAQALSKGELAIGLQGAKIVKFTITPETKIAQ